MTAAVARAQVLLRCLRRCGWSDARIDEVLAHDITRQLSLKGRLAADEYEFYMTVLAGAGVD